MKKIFLTLFALLICSTAQAATTWYACTGNNNWNGANAWTSVQVDQVGCIASTGNPVAGDTAILNSTTGSNTVTISAAAAAATIDETGYTGTLAFGTQTLTLTGASNIGGAMTSTSGTIATTGNITLLSTATGTFPKIQQGGALTLTAGGFTWPGTLTFNNASTVTLNGNWTNTGLVTFAAAANLVVTSAETLTANGGLTMTSASGTTGSLATIILGGGTWSGANAIANNLTLAGNITVSGSVAYTTGTLTYSSGTITTTGSTLVINNGASTLNTNGIVWNNIQCNAGTTVTHTLTSNLNASGTLSILNGTVETFSGAFNISAGSLNFQGGINASSLTMNAGQTLSVTNSLLLQKGYGNNGADVARTIKSATASSPIYLNYTGTLANEQIFGITFTDVYASAPTVPFYGPSLLNYNGGTLTRTQGIKNVNASNINLKQVNYANIAS